MASIATLQRKKPSIKRLYSDNTQKALYKQIVAAEELKRVTNEALDAKEIIERPVVVLFERLSKLFETCNAEDQNVNHGADIVLIIRRDDTTQHIYCHRAIIAISPVLGEIVYSKLIEHLDSK